MKNILISVILVAIVVGVVWFFIPKSSQPNQPAATTPKETNIVTITNFSFNPNVLTVKQSTKVTWINQDTAAHTIASSTFNSPELNQGGTFEFTFNDKGNFDYNCSLHPAMKAKIIME